MVNRYSCEVESSSRKYKLEVRLVFCLSFFVTFLAPFWLLFISKKLLIKCIFLAMLLNLSMMYSTIGSIKEDVCPT